MALSKEMGVSRTPIRLALQRLATEGLIVMKSNQAAMVAKPSAKSATEVFFMRALLESAAASLACRFAMDADVKRLRDAIEEENLAFRSRVLWDYLKANARVHLLIADLARNETLRATIEQFINQSNVILSLFDPFYGFSEEEESTNYEEDLAILEAISLRDEELAGKRMKDHIMRSFANLPLDDLDNATSIIPRLK